MPSNAHIFALDPIISLNLSSSSHPLRIWIWTRWVGDTMRCRVALSLVTASGNSTPSCWSCEPSFTSMHSAGLGRWIGANGTPNGTPDGTPDGTLSSFEVSPDFMRFHEISSLLFWSRKTSKQFETSQDQWIRVATAADFRGALGTLGGPCRSNFQLLTWSIIWVQPLCKIPSGNLT